MNHRQIFFMTLFTGLLAAAQPAQAENPSEIGFGCAPWDGPTLEIKIGAPDTIINVSIWAKGYEELEKGGKTVDINNREISPGDSSGTGRATIRGTMVAAPPESGGYQSVAVVVHFDQLEMKEGGAAAGYVQQKDSDVKFPFSGIIGARLPCG